MSENATKTKKQVMLSETRLDSAFSNKKINNKNQIQVG